VVEAQRTIAAACKRHGVVAGIHVATPEYAQKMIEDGYRFVTLGSDSRMLAVQAAADVAVVRKTVTGGVVPTY
jgi:4-hydroxy-2-oxoheptanedioate aldolase